MHAIVVMLYFKIGNSCISTERVPVYYDKPIKGKMDISFVKRTVKVNLNSRVFQVL